MRCSYGKYVDIDLTSGRISEYKIPEVWRKLYLGGRGVAARILCEVFDGTEDALSRENTVIFGSGPLQGTGIAGASRHVVMALSPKTKTVCDSYAGGSFGNELGKSGYDGVILRGRAETPVYVAVIDGDVRIEPADDVWGSDTGTTHQFLTTRYPRASVSCIGQAGENLVSFSCIINDQNRAAGRSGFGAVLGWKRVKALVVRGSARKGAYDAQGLNDLRKHFAEAILANPGIREVGELGTAGAVLPLNEVGLLPTRNFREGTFEGAERISGERLHSSILDARDGCPGCPIRCKRRVRTEFDGVAVVPEYGGPEYETLAAFGSLCGNDDLTAIALLNQKCNQYGLDTISAGSTLAFAMEAQERGMLQCGLKWGDASGMVRMIDRIVHREGVGNLLADGVAKLADQIGADFAVVVKGMEVPMHEPRGKRAVGLSYATSPRGANHMEVYHDGGPSGFVPDELDVPAPVEWGSWKDRAAYCKTYEDLCSFTNCLILCAITSWDIMGTGGYYPYPTLRRLVEATTGSRIDVDEMLKIGERGYLLMRWLSGRFGITRAADMLPKRLMAPLENGPLAGTSTSHDDLAEAMREYYLMRGYEHDGFPSEGRLGDVGMDEFVESVIRRTNR